MNPRLVAHNILCKLEKNFSNSALLLADSLSQLEDPRDRNFVTDLVLGILRWRGKLLFWIRLFAKRPISQIDSKVSVILQIGIYQLVFQKASAHAAIFETVELCRKVKVSSATPFVNGVLRGIQRKLLNLPEPEEFHVRWSHPEWLALRWEERFGRAEASDLMQCNNTPPPLYITVNQLAASPNEVKHQLAKEQVAVRDTAFGPGVLEVIEGAPQKTVPFANGLFYIQDAAIATLSELLRSISAEKILEIAAAPGGKTLQLAMHFGRRAIIASIDSDIRRMHIWRENLNRLKVGSAHGVVANGKLLPFATVFDCVVIDAPCSSLGVIRRHPEIKWWRKPEHLPGIRALQSEIVTASARILRPGGALIYSVCSFEPEETTAVITDAAAFELTNEIFLYPHLSRTDGFYFAALRKK